MSWGEVCKINSDLSKPLNELIDDLLKKPRYAIYTQSQEVVIEKDGIYRIIAIGKGGNGNTYGGGGAGGVSVLEHKLITGATYTATISDGSASFGQYVTATAGTESSSSGLGEGGRAYGMKGAILCNGGAGKRSNGGSVTYPYNLTDGGRGYNDGGYGCFGGRGGNGDSVIGLTSIPHSSSSSDVSSLRAKGDTAGLGGGNGGIASLIQGNYGQISTYNGSGGGGGFGGGGGSANPNASSSFGGSGGASAVILLYLREE